VDKKETLDSINADIVGAPREEKQGVHEKPWHIDVTLSMHPLVKELLPQIVENVEESGEKASFTIKCELAYNKEVFLHHSISGQATIKTTPMVRRAFIRNGELSFE
jgi:hypothetical protein